MGNEDLQNNSGSNFACGGDHRCHPRTEFCDPYESNCQSCSILCSVDAKFNECVERCKPYLQVKAFSFTDHFLYLVNYDN